jgi:hypothetical protein
MHSASRSSTKGEEGVHGFGPSEPNAKVRRSDAFGPLPRDDISPIAAFLDLPEPEERCD